MVVGINSNAAASAASANLTRASSTVQDSVARLSSGQRIIRASDDAAGLAIGTSISTTVTSLEIALLNTEQARSVLQIADGAADQLTQIVARQKALSVQSNSGSISDTERGFLNQEFTALTAEIDRIVNSTNFNGITLLDGSVAGNAATTIGEIDTTAVDSDAVPADIATVAPTAGTAYSFTADVTTLTSGVIEAGDIDITLTNFDDATAQGDLSAVTFSEVSFDADFGGSGFAAAILSADINGKTYISDTINADDAPGAITGDITFTAADGSEFVVDIQGVEDLAAGLPAADGNAATLISALEGIFDQLTLQQTREATITVPGVGDTLEGLESDDVQITSTNFNTTDDDFGSIGEFTVTAGATTTSTITVDVTDANGTVTTFNASDVGSGDTSVDALETLTLVGRDSLGVETGETIEINFSALTNGSIDVGTEAGAAALSAGLNDLFGVTASGSATPEVFSTNGTADATYVTAVDVSSFTDTDYQGEGFGTVNVANFDENSGTEQIVLQTTLGDNVYTSNQIESNGGSGDIAAQDVVFTAEDGSSFTLSLAAQTGAIDTEVLADTLAANITTALADVDILQERTLTSVDVTQTTNTVLEGVTATSVSIVSNQFDTTNASFGDFSSFSGVAGSDTANSISVQLNGTTFSATDLGGADDILDSSDATITLLGRNSDGSANGEQLKIDISGLTRSIDLTNQDELNSLTSALNTFTGTGASGAGGLSFQVGSSVTDTISINIASVSSSGLYVDDSGVSQTLSIDTQANAQAATSILDNALSALTSLRADIGSSLSRFEFAASNIETSIANQDAARSSFLDADIARESTAFAAAQVQNQAATAMLAQANQLPQTILQLLQ